MLHVAILSHRHDPYDKRLYWLKPIAASWQQEGIKTTLVRGPADFTPADVAILHVNLTKTPKSWLDLARRYPKVINGGVTDISKRAISPLLLSRDDRYEGAVIVKTDNNANGFPEVKIASRHSWLWRGGDFDDYRLAVREISRCVGGDMAPRCLQLYQIFACAKEVPREDLVRQGTCRGTVPVRKTRRALLCSHMALSWRSRTIDDRFIRTNQ